MNFDIGEKERIISERIRGLFDPDSMAAISRLEKGDLRDLRQVLLHWMGRLSQTGYLSLGLDEGKNSVALVACRESLAEISPSLFLAVEASIRVFGRIISVYAAPEQKADILPALQEGRIIGAVGLSEQGMNIEGNPINTSGTPGGDGFRLSGSKCHVVNAPIADIIAVAGRVKDRLAFFLVEKGNQGLLAGPRFSLLGYGGAAVSSVSLEDCPVSSRHVIGPFEGDEPLRTVRAWEDQILTAAGLGLMRRSFDAALHHAKSHKSGGKPIIAYQEIGFKLAEMLTLFQTAQLLAYRAAWMDEAGDGEEDVLAHCAKVFCTESAEQVTSQALQILGQHGYLQGNAAEEGYRDAKYLQIAGTSSEIGRMKIGDQVLERN